MRDTVRHKELIPAGHGKVYNKGLCEGILFFSQSIIIKTVNGIKYVCAYLLHMDASNRMPTCHFPYGTWRNSVIIFYFVTWIMCEKFNMHHNSYYLYKRSRRDKGDFIRIGNFTWIIINCYKLWEFSIPWRGQNKRYHFYWLVLR